MNPDIVGNIKGIGTMRKRSFSIILLVVAFLFIARSNVIAAAFCPRYMSSRNCHIQQQPQQVEHKSSCQHEIPDMVMGDMKMDDTAMESEAATEIAANSIAENPSISVATESSAEQVAIDFPAKPCGHCWMHSQPISGTATLVAVDPSKRMVETSARPADFVVTLPSAFTISIIPLEHGPPGISFPRYVLISVFRI
jgi:hypothetical protein